MTALVPRSLDWIDAAPLRISAHATSTAPPDAVFAVLADHERWPEWFPAVKKVVVLGPAEGVGARRRVVIPGVTFDEEFIVWDPGSRWSFTGTAVRPTVVRSLVEDCRLEPGGAGGTSIDYTMYLDPVSWLRLPLKALSGRISATNTKAMQALARRAEGR